MKIRKISKNVESDIEDLKHIIKENVLGNKTFRYFDKREFSCVDNHLLTNLYYVENDCVGYGHLDHDGENVWLGIMVLDKHVGKGYGNTIFEALINSTNSDISLSVDKINIKAINLYKKYKFVIFSENEYSYKMILKK
jgi:ribosomal protein S18 acetylase RimI-like enzyme